MTLIRVVALCYISPSEETMKAGEVAVDPEVCEAIGLEDGAVRRMHKSGELPGFKVGYVWRIPPAGLRLTAVRSHR
jgi:hypothetical protein